MDRTLSASVGIGGGNRSADVKTIQEMLNKALPGWGGPMPKLVTDGVCGNLTKSAIRRFQEVQDRQSGFSGYNRRGSKDSQLR